MEEVFCYECGGIINVADEELAVIHRRKYHINCVSGIVLALCGNCGVYVATSEMFERYSDGALICDDCRREYHFRCSTCDELYHNDDDVSYYRCRYCLW
jgi:hypothetical protein